MSFFFFFFLKKKKVDCYMTNTQLEINFKFFFFFLHNLDVRLNFHCQILKLHVNL
jgi:hypothetical protein